MGSATISRQCKQFKQYSRKETKTKRTAMDCFASIGQKVNKQSNPFHFYLFCIIMLCLLLFFLSLVLSLFIKYICPSFFVYYSFCLNTNVICNFFRIVHTKKLSLVSLSLDHGRK